MRLFIFALLLSMGSFSFAQNHSHGYNHDFHTEEVCHHVQRSLCIHLGFEEAPEVEKESQFTVHIVGPQNTISQIRGAKVDLWMDMGGHGHGSAPVKVQRLKVDHFFVTEAFFVMKGEWQVRVQVQTTTQKYDFIIPVQVKK